MDSLLESLLNYRDLILELEFPLVDEDDQECFYTLERTLQIAFKNLSEELLERFNSVTSDLRIAIGSDNIHAWENLDDELIDLYNYIQVLSEKNYFYATYLTGFYEDVDYKSDRDFVEYYANNIITWEDCDEATAIEYSSIELEHIANEIRRFVNEASHPVSREDLMRNVEGCTNKVIRYALESGGILNYRGSYYAADKLNISASDKASLRKLMISTTYDFRQHHIEDLFRRVKCSYTYFLNSNYIRNANQLFAVVAYLYKGEFNFSWPFYADKNKTIEDQGQLIDSFIDSKEELTVDNLVSFAKEEGIVIPSILRLIKSIENTVLLKNKREFVLTRDIEVTSEAILTVTQMISSELKHKKCCAIRDLSSMPNFPKINISWNEWFIYSLIGKVGVGLVVDTTSSQFKHAIPIIALQGVNTGLFIDSIKKKYDGQVSNTAELCPENLDRIDDLLEDLMEEELIEALEDI